MGAPFNYNIPPNPMAPQPPSGPSSSNTSSANEKKELNNFNNDFNSAFIREEAGGGHGGPTTVGEDANAAAYVPPPSYDSLSPDDNLAESNKPKPQPRSKLPQDSFGAGGSAMPDLPNVPLDLPDIPDDANNDDIDFDDLSKRFEALKKRK